MKKLITTLLAAAMLLSVSIVPAFAVNTDEVVYDGSEPTTANMVISADVIEKGAFNGNDTIVNLTIAAAPNRVTTYVKSDTFNDMPNLETVTFAGRISLTYKSFVNCPNLKTVTISDVNNVAGNVSAFLGNYAFSGAHRDLHIYGTNDAPKTVRIAVNATGMGAYFYSTDGTIVAGQEVTTPSQPSTPSQPTTPTITGCSDWAKEIIASAISKDLVPDSLQSSYTQNITRQEMCFLVMQLLRKTDVEIPTPGKVPFTDINIFFVTPSGVLVSNYDVVIAAQLGIVNGTSPTTFNPSGDITREQAATMLTRFAKITGLTSGSKINFGDASGFSSWAVEGIDFISGLVDPVTGAAVMSGTSPTEFSPQGTFTREQAITTALRLANCLGVE